MAQEDSNICKSALNDSWVPSGLHTHAHTEAGPLHTHENNTKVTYDINLHLPLNSWQLESVVVLSLD